jgi:hypothetical protein
MSVERKTWNDDDDEEYEVREFLTSSHLIS